MQVRLHCNNLEMIILKNIFFIIDPFQKPSFSPPLCLLPLLLLMTCRSFLLFLFVVVAVVVVCLFVCSF